jgi:general secretion pathway protein F
MPKFSYKAATPNGEIIQGDIEAPDRQSVAATLLTDGNTPIHVKEAEAQQKEKTRIHLRFGSNRLSRKDIDLFTLELSTLLKADLPLDRALDTIMQLPGKPAVKKLISAINQEIRQGESLSRSLENQDGHFDRIYLNMVKTGETTGALDLALDRLAEFRTRSRELRESLLSALIYPAILLSLAMIAVSVMLAFVVPRFAEMFADADRELPLLTQIVIATGNFIGTWWPLIIVALFGMGYWFMQQMKNPIQREWWDQKFIGLPLIGSLIITIQTARFTRTLATLLNSGVSALIAMDIAKEVVSNRIIARDLIRIADRVRQGDNLGRSLGDSKILPPLVHQLLTVGEETGRLGEMLEQLTEIFERDSRAAIQRMLTLTEPMLIIGIGGVISVIVLSIVQAIIETNNLVF